MTQDKQNNDKPDTGLSRLRITINRLFELLDLEQEDEYGILKPTEYALITGLNLVLKVYDNLGANFPIGSVGTDDTGSIRIVWHNRIADKKVSVFCPHSSNETTYVYYQKGESYGSEDLQSTKLLADRIVSVYQD